MDRMPPHVVVGVAATIALTLGLALSAVAPAAAPTTSDGPPPAPRASAADRSSGGAAERPDIDEDGAVATVHSEALDADRFPERHRTHYSMGSGHRHGFISTCPYVRADTVDPIIFPGEADASHRHDFFGNESTDEDTTTASLVDAGTTSCQHADDLSAYWTPSAIDDGEIAEVVGTSMYYFTDKVEQQAEIQPMPVGLRMIAGSADADRPQPPEVMRWEEHRNAKNNTADQRSMIDARRKEQVVMRVNFPQCWNGTHLDATDHRSHMAYADGGRCPGSHPVLLPQLSVFVRYDADGGQDFELSSGPWYTAHADFWNAWHPEVFADVLDECRTVHCDRISSR